MSNLQSGGRPPLRFGELIRRLAKERGATVLLEPTWGIVGQITFRNGRVTYFSFNTLDLNTGGAAAIAKDKAHTEFFLNHFNFPTPPETKTFFSTAWGRELGVRNQGVAAAIKHARTIGFPVIIKPNRGSQGQAVTKAYSVSELRTAIASAFEIDRVCIVQKPVAGNDYRIVVYKDQVVAVYKRIPLQVVGDGQRSIKQLLTRLMEQQRKEGRPVSGMAGCRERIQSVLSRQNYTFESVVPEGGVVALLDNANLSTGGTAVDETTTVHPTFKSLSVELVKKLGLTLAGVDLMVEGSISEPVQRYCVLEVNASPGLDHFAALGTAQALRVEKLYRNILDDLEHRQ